MASGGVLASDTCEEWCAVSAEEHRDASHSRIVGRVELWGSAGVEGDLFLELRRPYVEGVPIDEVRDRHVSVVLSQDDDDPMLKVTTGVARSLAAALLRAVDLAETAGRRRG